MNGRKARVTAKNSVWGYFAVLLSATSLSACTDGASSEPQVRAQRSALGVSVFINELHYDNSGTDSGEAIEIAGPSGVDLGGYSLVLYNGANGAVYDTRALSGVLPDQAAGFGTLAFAYPANGIQNGSPDGVALIGPGGSVLQFVSYEGMFSASAGPAAGFTSVDIGVAENGTEAPGQSLQLRGSGSVSDDFEWSTASAASFGAINAGQQFAGGNAGTGGAGGNAGAGGADGSAGSGGGAVGGSGGGTALCGAPATPIHAVQGTTSASPLVGREVSIEGVVVGDFQGSPQGLGGFFLQEEDAEADLDPKTSEGIFVFDAGSAVDVALGDVVRVTGKVTEYFELTELNAVTHVQICGTGSVTRTALALPLAADSDLEPYEGMSVQFAQKLFAADTYTLGRYGEVTLSAKPRSFQPTHLVEPGAPAQALAAENARARLQLDDGRSQQNPATPPYLSADGTLRVGDSIENLHGVLGFGFGLYELHPTAELGSITFNRENPREAAAPAPNGSLRVAGFNVLNFFTTLDTGGTPCGPQGGLECRGANSASEFTRQRAKILAALVAIDADVVGLIELENNERAAISDLVAGLNASLGAGTYAFIDTGSIGSDAIRVGLVYKPARVTPVGAHALLDRSVDPAFIDTLNRPVLAQTFRAVKNGETFTVAVNHLKSKGSACVSDPDLGDGQGNCNRTRTAAAAAEVAWLATDPTHSQDPDFLLLGDFNSYAKEDPIRTLKSGGYRDLLAENLGGAAYSYVFDGQAGYLDHALASPALAAKVAQVSEWHINADEPIVLDYNQEFNPPFLYAPGPFRASDHDPVIIDLQLPEVPTAPTCNGKPATIYVGRDGRVVGGPQNGTKYTGVLVSGSGPNVIVGSAGNDIIYSGGGGDTVCGLAGNDLLLGGTGSDTLYGGAGNDVLEGGPGQDSLFGEAGNDVLLGGLGSDHCDGGAGTDAKLSCETALSIP